MTLQLAILAAIFLVIIAAAVGFGVWPALREKEKSRRARLVVTAALGLAILGIGGGTYILLGQPHLALRTLEGDNATNHNALIARLAKRMVEAPGDPRGWALLGRAYLTTGDPDQAAKAFARAVALEKNPDAALLSAYGEAQVMNANGAVTADAEKIFRDALARNPKDAGARYYLGLAGFQRGNAAEAEGFWQSLLADLPTTEPFRAVVLDRLAQVKAQNNGGVDIQAMVEGLAARLKAEPNDGEGWRRLIRAYSVLGDMAKAKSALQQGRAALAADATQREALEREARELKLD